MKVLVTGGAGYVGSVTATALEGAGHTPVILDSLLTGPRAFVGSRIFYQGDIADRALLTRVIGDHPDIGCTLHLAARTVVDESVRSPYPYYRDNLAGTLELVDSLLTLGKPRVVFASSAAVYAGADGRRVAEDAPVEPASPYARTKLMTEQVLGDLAAASELRAVILRYFNPIGADPGLASGVHVRQPSHVLGQLIMAARGQTSAFTLNGADYPTRDGTVVRDYVHVWDLALAHAAVVDRFDAALTAAGASHTVINLGSGSATTVRELLSAFERVSGAAVPTIVGPRRAGDTVGTYADISKAREILLWQPVHSLDQGVASAIAWNDRRRDLLGYD